MHRGTYTSQAKTKAGNRRSEVLLGEVELWSSLAAALTTSGTDAYPLAELEQAWRQVLTLQFHDIIPGSSIAWVHDDAEAAYTRLDASLTALRSAALSSLTPTVGGDVLLATEVFGASPGKRELTATVAWMDDEPLLPGRQYDFKLGPQRARASVNPLKYRIDPGSDERLATERLELNDIGVGELSLDRLVAFAPHARHRELGGFILVDRSTQRTAAFGLLHFALHRARNVRWQALGIDREARARQKQQQPAVLWFTGLSGAGKSTIANLVEQRLVELGRHTYLLDGDNVRHGLNRDLGFTQQDRVENVRRVTEVAALMADAGLIVLVAMISPFRAERAQARERLASSGFVEVFIDTPLAVAESRDVKGLYARARAGELRNFTGVDSPYEPPLEPDIHINTGASTPVAAAEQIVAALLADAVSRASP